MKISKLFHWLYAIIMLLPIAVIPIFAIYSHRHTIDIYAIEVPQNEVVDFNQQIKNGNFDNSNDWSAMSQYVSLSITDNQGICVDLVGSSVGSEWQKGIIQNDLYLVEGHKYYFNIDFNSDDISLYGVEFGQYNTYSVSTIGHYSDVIDMYVNNYSHILIFAKGTYNADSTFYVSNVWLTDLTQMFGSGNEPTKEVFESYFSDNYYEYTLSHKELLKNVGLITYDDSDIGSQMLYSFYNTTDKYFALNKLFGLGGLYDWFLLNMFGGNCPLGFTIFWNLLTYWLIISIFWLLFDVMIYVPQLVHRWLDKGVIE